jgi:hypothetical protein
MYPAKQKKPSYLAKVKEELIKGIISMPWSLGKPVYQDLAEKTWDFVSKKLTQSYWNGVSAGASGRVKPKGRKFEPEKEESSYAGE